MKRETERQNITSIIEHYMEWKRIQFLQKIFTPMPQPTVVAKIDILV